MYREILQQPACLEETLLKEREKAEEIGREIRRFAPHAVLVAARGTSDNVATYARYLFQLKNHLPVASATPSLYTFYDATLKLDKVLAIGISQSGETPDVVECIRRARKEGALTCAITNTENSSLEKVAHFSLIGRSGKEEAVAATKTFTTCMSIIALLSSAWADEKAEMDKLYNLPYLAERMLSLLPLIEAEVERFSYAEAMAVLSRGICYPIALEVALKIRETAIVDADGFSSADFLHGPIAVVGKNFPVFLIAPLGRVYGSLLDTAHQVKKRGGRLIVLSNGKEMLRLAHTPFPIPLKEDELLLSIPSVIPGQLFAFFLALARDLNPDKPYGLSKVTYTW